MVRVRELHLGIVSSLRLEPRGPEPELDFLARWRRHLDPASLKTLEERGAALAAPLLFAVLNATESGQVRDPAPMVAAALSSAG